MLLDLIYSVVMQISRDIKQGLVPRIIDSICQLTLYFSAIHHISFFCICIHLGAFDFFFPSMKKAFRKEKNY